MLTGFILYSIVLATLALAGPLSRRRIDGQTCTASELVILILLWVIWGGISVCAAFWDCGAESGVHVPNLTALGLPLAWPIGYSLTRKRPADP